jgi:hypothetical protein
MASVFDTVSPRRIPANLGIFGIASYEFLHLDLHNMPRVATLFLVGAVCNHLARQWKAGRSAWRRTRLSFFAKTVSSLATSNLFHKACELASRAETIAGASVYSPRCNDFPA